METRKTPLQPDTFYHIYNRGINRQDMFFAPRFGTFAAYPHTKRKTPSPTNWEEQYKGAISKQLRSDLNDQINKLHSGGNKER